MKWLRNIKDFTEHILSNKERAAKRHLNQTKGEKPREVFDRACLLIAEELSTIGFRYFSSQHKVRLESTDKKFSLLVRFSSNRDNVAGHYVELSSFFHVNSKDLRKFSKSNPLLSYWSEKMIGRDIGTLVKGGEGNLIWNLADTKEFENAVSTIPKTIRERLVNVFSDLQNSELVVSEIESDKFELNNPITTVQYLLMANRKDVAEKYLSSFLNRKPEKILEDYKNAVKLFDSEGLPEDYVHGMGYGYEIALLENEYNLKVEVPM